MDNTLGKSYVFLEISLDSAKHLVIFELFTDIAPKTCENFR